MFANRIEAGKRLAKELRKYKKDCPLVLALPRGGVVIGFEVAKLLRAPLDVIISRKLGAPNNPEFGIGAISENEAVFLDGKSISSLGISEQELLQIKIKEQKELQRRIDLYRNGKNLPDLKNKTVILVDDGVATGVTAKAAILAIKKLKPKKIIFASPVCAGETVKEIEAMNVVVTCIKTPIALSAIATFYHDFAQVSDEEVIKLLTVSSRT